MTVLRPLLLRCVEFRVQRLVEPPSEPIIGIILPLPDPYWEDVVPPARFVEERRGQVEAWLVDARKTPDGGEGYSRWRQVAAEIGAPSAVTDYCEWLKTGWYVAPFGHPGYSDCRAAVVDCARRGAQQDKDLAGQGLVTLQDLFGHLPLDDWESVDVDLHRALKVASRQHADPAKVRVRFVFEKPIHARPHPPEISATGAP